jgi:hypothetical protein
MRLTQAQVSPLQSTIHIVAKVSLTRLLPDTLCPRSVA